MKKTIEEIMAEMKKTLDEEYKRYSSVKRKKDPRGLDDEIHALEDRLEEGNLTKGDMRYVSGKYYD